MNGDQLLYTWPDGHRLLRDKWQWVVRHPRGCKNAFRGSSGHGGMARYAPATYLTQPENAVAELKACRLPSITTATLSATPHFGPQDMAGEASR